MGNTQDTTAKRANWGRIDTHMDEAEITVSGEVVAMITKTHGQPAGALSLVDTRGAIEHYEVTRDSDDATKFFAVNDGNWRQALRGAVAWAAGGA